jgi:hypothetical protein
MSKPLPITEITDLHLLVLFRAAAQDGDRMKGRAIGHLFNTRHKNHLTGIIRQLKDLNFIDTSEFDRTASPCYTWIQITQEGEAYVRNLVTAARQSNPL